MTARLNVPFADPADAGASPGRFRPLAALSFLASPEFSNRYGAAPTNQ